MARGKFITNFERDCIRIGHAAGIPNATIARALRRTRPAIGNQIAAMEAEGSLSNLPICFVVEDIERMIRTAGALERGGQ